MTDSKKTELKPEPPPPAEFQEILAAQVAFLALVRYLEKKGLLDSSQFANYLDVAAETFTDLSPPMETLEDSLRKMAQVFRDKKDTKGGDDGQSA